MSKHEIVIRELSELSSYANNARTHSDDQIAQLVGSIQEYGFTNPLLIDSDNMILAGHGRYEAAQLAHLGSVPCIVLDYLSDAQKKAYVIADNKLALNAGWDDPVLLDELRGLTLDNFDVSLIGFTDSEIAGLAKSLESVVELDMPVLNEGDRNPLQQMTFTLHESQVETVKQAIAAALDRGELSATDNPNRNGNAIAHVCETFMGMIG